MALFHYKYFYPNAKLVIIAPASKLKEGGWQRTINEFDNTIEYDTCSYNMLNKRYKEFANMFIVFDECHRLKNSTGVWGKAGYNLTKITSGFILLSATPLANGWIDSINYFKMFNLTKNKTRFLKDNAIYDMSHGYMDIIGWKNENKLKTMWNLFSKRLDKSQAIDLPNIIFENVYFTESKIYKKILKTRVFNDEIYDSLMKLRHGLRLYCNLEEKIQYLKDFIEDTNDNIVIFYNYDKELQLLKSIINKKIYVCNGHEKNYPKKDEWDNIKNTVTISNYKTGSEAVEFTYANIIVYFSPTESYTEFYQSYGRCYRVGQNKKVTVYKFITKNTIEEQIYNNLDKKVDFNVKRWEEKILNEPKRDN